MFSPAAICTEGSLLSSCSMKASIASSVMSETSSMRVARNPHSSRAVVTGLASSAASM